MKTGVFCLKNFAILDKFALAVSYQQIYRAAPWNEWKKCSNPSCGEHWGIGQKPELEQLEFRHCDLPVQDYWPHDYLFNEFERMSKLPGFNVALAYNINLGKMIGFCWGYQIEVNNLDNELRLPGLKDQVLLETKESVNSVVYLSEIAVDINYRGKGVARELLKSFFEENHHSSYVIAKTRGRDNPCLANLWFSRLGFKSILSYNDDRGREIQFSKIDSLLE